MESPVVFKGKKYFKPFSTALCATSQYASLGDLKLFNLVTVYLNVTSQMVNVGGISIGMAGRTLDTEAVSQIFVNGVMNGDVYEGSSIAPKIIKAGKYKIQFDVSMLISGYLWMYFGSSSGSLTIDDVVDLRVSVQTAASLPPVLSKEMCQLNITASTTINLVTKNKNALFIQMLPTAASPTALYYSFWLEGINNYKTSKVVQLYDKDGRKIEGVFNSTSGILSYNLYQNVEYNFYADVKEFTGVSVRFSDASAGALTVSGVVLSLDNFTIDNSPIVKYQSKNFNIVKSKPVWDCYADTFVYPSHGKTILYISTTGIDGEYSAITLNSANFPNLISGSVIYKLMVLPRDEQITSYQQGLLARVVVITDKSQIYHNYPFRSGGVSLAGDELIFDESVVWDLPVGQTTRRHPSSNPDEARDGYRYDPTLPTFATTLVPAVNADNGFGMGGWDAEIGTGAMVRPRFYNFRNYDIANVDSKLLTDHMFRTLGNVSKDRKVTVLGAYGVYSQRICLFATTDGGRSWYTIYEFSNSSLAQFRFFGNAINTSTLGAYTADSFSIKKRTTIPPSALAKEPTNIFALGEAVKVTSISNATTGVVTTASAHGLTSKDAIVFIKDTSDSPAWEFMCNNTHSATSAGTGMIYLVDVIDATSFRLYEYIYNPDSNLPARHIHYTNLQKDFVAFGTGERYPDGWLMLMEQKFKDLIALDYTSANPVCYRLNSSETGVQRICSFWMLDDDTVNPTIYFAADDAYIARTPLAIAGRTGTPSRASTGVFKGKLADIDDYSKFASVLNIPNMNLDGENLNGTIILSFMSGKNAISFDGGDTWEIIDMIGRITVAGMGKDGIIYFKEGYKLLLK